MRKHEHIGGAPAEGMPIIALLRHVLCLPPPQPFYRRNPDLVNAQAPVQCIIVFCEVYNTCITPSNSQTLLADVDWELGKRREV